MVRPNVDGIRSYVMPTVSSLLLPSVPKEWLACRAQMSVDTAVRGQRRWPDSFHSCSRHTLLVSSLAKPGASNRWFRSGMRTAVLGGSV